VCSGQWAIPDHQSPRGGKSAREVEREAVNALEFATKAGSVSPRPHRHAARTDPNSPWFDTEFGCFDDDWFDEARVEKKLASTLSSSERVLVLDAKDASPLPCGTIARRGCRISSAPAGRDVTVILGNGGKSLLWARFPARRRRTLHLPREREASRSSDNPPPTARNLGGALPENFENRARSSARRSRESKDAYSMPSASMKRPSAPHTSMGSSTTRRLPARLPRGSMRLAVSTGSRMCICGTPATAISVGSRRKGAAAR